jgi:AraC-like DNA-binding protein
VHGTVLRPSPALAPFVSSIGFYEGRHAHAWERALPTGGMQLLVNLDADALHMYASKSDRPGSDTRGAALQGPSAQPTVIDTADQRAIVCVVFRLAGAYPFLRMPASDARDVLVDLDDVWPCGGGIALRDRLLASPDVPAMLRTVEEVLVERAVRPLDHDRAISVAGRALNGGASVAQAADRLGWTTRTLARRFGTLVGLSPKRFARVRRFQRLLGVAAAGAAAPDWARLATECGYHDQAHMIHEFRELAGSTPGEYAPRSPGEHNHVVVSDSYNRGGDRRDRMAA